MTTVNLEGVTKEYGATTALTDVDLDVEEGEFFTLLGPSGCGKTTTLRLIAGFETPTAGRVRIDGNDVSGVPPEARNVGVVFQNYALFPHMSVRENVAYGLQFSDPPGGSTPEQRVTELLELVDLEGMAARAPRSLSGGQQQRVALARALAPSPRLLLLDEPLSALDAQLRERLRVQVREIQRDLGITTVYVTHDQEEALAISDRVAVLNRGRVEQVGDPRVVYREPASRFVAEFVGDNSLFEGTVTEVADDNLTARVAESDLVISTLGTDWSPGDRVRFCVRPGQFRLDTSATDCQNRLPVTIRSVEFLGESTRIHCEWEGIRITLRTGEHSPDIPTDPGSVVEVGFRPQDAHLLPMTR